VAIHALWTIITPWKDAQAWIIITLHFTQTYANVALGMNG